MDFSVEDFLVIVERRSLNTWKKEDSGEHVLWRFLFGPDKIAVTADVISYDEGSWSVSVKSQSSDVIDASDEFFGSFGGVVHDFLSSKKPDSAFIAFNGRFNAPLAQSISLKRSIEKLGYFVTNSMHPDRFSINITKEKAKV